MILKRKFSAAWIAIAATLIFSAVPLGGIATSAEAKDSRSNLMTATDLERPVIELINTETDKKITIDLSMDPMWPGGAPLHTLITPGGSKAYLSIMSSDVDPLTVAALKIGDIDWDAGTADVSITNVMRVEEPASKPSILVPTQTDPSQPITSLWTPGNHQLHGPTLHPSGKFAYFTQWTDNKIRVIDTSTDDLAAPDPIQFGTFTRQMHGVYFNPAGNKALGPAYYFDLNYLTLFRVGKLTGDLTLVNVIPLTVSEESKQYAAFTHFVVWLDNRFAITGAQQIGPTSLTPSGFDVVGPSVWLIDTRIGEAEMIIGPVDSPDKPGIFKPASDVMVVGKKLYVAEEDSMDDETNAEGFISIWDITDRKQPKFMKRLAPGGQLPGNFQFGHGLARTTDGEFLYVEDFSSNNIVKIDTSSDSVVKVFSEQDGFVHPHGIFITGNFR